MEKTEKIEKIRNLDTIIKEHFNVKKIHTDAFIEKVVSERNSLCQGL